MSTRSLSTVLTAVLAAGLVPAAVPTSPAAAVPPVPVLTGLHAVHRGGTDRVVLTFRHGLPDVRTRYVDRLVADGSGRPVRISGRAVLQVRLEPADAHDASGPTAPRRVAFALPNVMTAVRAGDFEAVTTYGIGLARKAPVSVRRVPERHRVVVRIGAGFRTVERPVWFFDVDRFRDNTEPFFVPRSRPVLPRTPARGLMDRLYAGPLPAERADGLRLLRSGSSGVSGPTISDGVARVRLTGGCRSGGSTVTVAGEIIPTLRRLETVDWVKVYDPSGHTEHPRGHRDSVPTCLEP